MRTRTGMTWSSVDTHYPILLRRQNPSGNTLFKRPTTGGPRSLAYITLTDPPRRSRLPHSPMFRLRGTSRGSLCEWWIRLREGAFKIFVMGAAAHMKLRRTLTRFPPGILCPLTSLANTGSRATIMLADFMRITVEIGTGCELNSTNPSDTECGERRGWSPKRCRADEGVSR